LGQLDGAAAILGFANDFDVRGGVEQRAQALANDSVIIGQQHSDFVAVTLVLGIHSFHGRKRLCGIYRS
jgi:hypothetical protein